MPRKTSSTRRQPSSAPAGLAQLWRKHRQQHHNAADGVHAALREAILQGVLPAGHQLGEIGLAALFGRSRTPIREAVLRLESEGLAVRSTRNGLVVAHISREEVLEVYAVREVLDGLAARLAALGILPTELDRLTWLNERLKAAVERGDARAMLQINIDFHEEICRASRNSLLQEFIARIHVWVHRFGDTTMSFSSRGLEAVAEHDKIIEAIRTRNADEAERLAREHMSRARQIRILTAQLADIADEETSPGSRARSLAPVDK